SSDVGGVQSVISDTIGAAIENLFTAGSTIVLMFAFDWRLTLFCLLFLPLFIVPSRRVGNLQRALVMEIQERMAQLSAHMQETLSISGALLVKTFGRQRLEEERFREAAQAIRTLNIRRAMVGRWFQMFMGLFSGVAPVVVYWYGGYEVIHHHVTLGTVVAFVALVQRLFGPISSLLGVNVTVLSSLALF